MNTPRAKKFPANTPRSRMVLAMCVSLILHFALAFVYLDSPQALASIEVRLLPPPPPAKKSQARKQIVSPSEAPESKPPEDTRKLSDKNTRAKLEQIRRGLPTPEAASSKPRPNPARKAQPRPPDRPAKLKLNEKQLAELPSLATNRRKKPRGEYASAKSLFKKLEPRETPDEERGKTLEEYVPYRRSANASLFRGRSGVPDFLPRIQDGDITLLNAKADRHAVFVRRVALQVFGALRRLNWSEVSFREARSLRDFATVTAVMSKDGQLKSVSLNDSSGITGFDQILLAAAKDGTWDQNPPPTAAFTDGNIHFVFKSRTWARPGAEGMRQQRWLLLATGLR